MPDQRLRPQDTHSTADGKPRGGGPRLIITVLLIVAALVVAYGVFGRRSGEGAKENAVGALTPAAVAVASA